MARRHATAVNCIDGRTHGPVLDQVATRFGVRHVDLVTAPGAVRHIAGEVTPVGSGVLDSVSVSLTVNHSSQIAVIAHQDCRANPIPDRVQEEQLARAAEVLGSRFPTAEVVALFLDFRTGFRRVG